MYQQVPALTVASDTPLAVATHANVLYTYLPHASISPWIHLIPSPMMNKHLIPASLHRQPCRRTAIPAHHLHLSPGERRLKKLNVRPSYALACPLSTTPVIASCASSAPLHYQAKSLPSREPTVRKNSAAVRKGVLRANIPESLNPNAPRRDLLDTTSTTQASHTHASDIAYH